MQRWKRELDAILASLDTPPGEDAGGEPEEMVFMVWFLLAFIPIFFVGTFLGVLVIAGQANKPGLGERLTAFVLFADVAFKVGATLVSEFGDYLLHLRVRNALRRRAALSRDQRYGCRPTVSFVFLSDQNPAKFRQNPGNFSEFSRKFLKFEEFSS